MAGILGLDPGGTTGWALYENGDWKRGQLGPHEHHEELWTMLHGIDPDTIVCESFEHRPHLPKAVLISRDYIGVVTLWAELNQRTLHMQTPAMGKKFWSDKKVKHLDLWIPGQQHAMDATRHVLMYLMHTLKDQSIIDQLKGL
jgi:hypothetical protein